MSLRRYRYAEESPYGPQDENMEWLNKFAESQITEEPKENIDTPPLVIESETQESIGSDGMVEVSNGESNWLKV